MALKGTSASNKKTIPATTSVGMAFKEVNRTNSLVNYYLQREEDVLHINSDNGVIKALEVNYLSRWQTTCDEIPYTDFEAVMKATIYKLDLGQFWNT